MEFDPDFPRALEDRAEELGLSLCASAIVGPEYVIDILHNDKNYMIKKNGDLVKVTIDQEVSGGICWNGDDEYRQEFRTLITEQSTVWPAVKNVNDVVNSFYE